jgi:hypothetical protein
MVPLCRIHAAERPEGLPPYIRLTRYELRLTALKMLGKKGRHAYQILFYISA